MKFCIKNTNVGRVESIGQGEGLSISNWGRSLIRIRCQSHADEYDVPLFPDRFCHQYRVANIGDIGCTGLSACDEPQCTG